MGKKNNAVLGIIIIIIGLLILVNNLNLFNFHFNLFDIGFLFSTFWPFFLIIPGLSMHSVFFSGKSRQAGILVPGGILLVIGITLQLSTIFHLWAVLWPGYILAVAVGLFELYYFGNRNKGLLIPVGILGGLSIIFFNAFTLQWFFGGAIRNLFIPVIMVILGLIILFRKKPSEYK